MRLVARLREPERFDALIEQPLAPPAVPLPHCELGRRYYGAIRGDDFIDDSFLIEDGGRVLLLAECDAQGELFGRFGFPAELRAAPELDDELCRQATRDLIGALFATAKERGATRLALRLRGDRVAVERLTTLLLGRNAVPRIELRVVADLAQTDEMLLADMRPHHRRHIRWGRDNLAVTAVGARNPDREAFERYRLFHAEIAGRVTRPLASWAVMFEAVAAGEGELILAHLDDRLVAGCMVLDAGPTSTYASGVYDRSLFDKPLGHFTIYHAMCGARERRRELFDLGEVPLSGTASDKEVSIGRFKQGFTSRTAVNVIWQLGADAKMRGSVGSM